MRLRFLLPVLAGLLAAVPWGRAEGPPPLRVVLPDGPCRVGEKIEVTVADVPAGMNPYDPRAIRLDAEITPPDGKTVTVPGFTQERCEERQVNGETRYVPTGGLDWRVRYAAPQAGEYRGRVVVTVGDSTRLESAPFRLRVETA
ncbi:MAG: DUF5060 domain-containing protein, partial [Caulobacteraceae bacterium]|nr:DUF5060 domain-containing protein [Caulobacter sp.]